MEVLNVIKARSIRVFDLNDLNPHGKRIIPEIIGWLRERYDFRKVPSSVDDLDDTKALAFLDGGAKSRSGEILAVDLRIYNDGIVADTKASTEHTDAFIDDVLAST